MIIQNIQHNTNNIVIFSILGPSYDCMPWIPCWERVARMCNSHRTFHRLYLLISSVYIWWELRSRVVFIYILCTQN